MKYIQTAMRSMAWMDRKIETILLALIINMTDLRGLTTDSTIGVSCWYSVFVRFIFLICGFTFELTLFSSFSVFLSPWTSESFFCSSRIVTANSTKAKIRNPRQETKYTPNAFSSDPDGLSDYSKCSMILSIIFHIFVLYKKNKGCI